MSLSLKDSLHHLNFTGGEPFLRSDFDQIISNFIENCDLSSVVISTNGSYQERYNLLHKWTIAHNTQQLNLCFNFQ